MWLTIFQIIVAPLFVGITLELFSKWLDKEDDD